MLHSCCRFRSCLISLKILGGDYSTPSSSYNINFSRLTDLLILVFVIYFLHVSKQFTVLHWQTSWTLSIVPIFSKNNATTSWICLRLQLNLSCWAQSIENLLCWTPSIEVYAKYSIYVPLSTESNIVGSRWGRKQISVSETSFLN